ncbi:MAG: tRNA (adenosine(37)-N6)-dimethylallyltransferase MiaA [Rhodothermaceae bacterium]|nr:tRNA (adenosine(37)-N6)-dimethylallyltransferase MiaA [Rhodothermaceae bacterium]
MVETRVFITGPTASGKTNVALELAKMWSCPVISADSRQCFRYLDIGTDKPSSEVLADVRHYNISVLDPAEEDSSRQFARRAANWEQEILASGKPVLIAGGSTLHLQELIFPMDNLPSRNQENMALLQQEESEAGLQGLYNRLKKVDPAYAASMDGLNPHRIYRALDVWMQTGKPFSSFHSVKKPLPGRDRFVFGLNMPRPVLHARINTRVDRMVGAGLVDEVRQLLDKGYDPGLQSLQSVGYREAIRYLKGECSHEEMVADIKTGSRRYARRQLTWLGRWKFIRWIDSENKKPADIAELISDTIRRVAAE